MRKRLEKECKEHKETQPMSYDEVVKMIEQSEKRVDEVLKAARLQRNEKAQMPKERLEMVLKYVVGILEMVFGVVAIMTFMYFMTH